MQGRKEKKNQLFPTTSWLQSSALTLEWLSSSYRHNTDLLRQQTQDSKAGDSFWYPSSLLHSFRNFCRSVSGNPFCWYFFWKAHNAVTCFLECEKLFPLSTTQTHLWEMKLPQCSEFRSKKDYEQWWLSLSVLEHLSQRGTGNWEQWEGKLQKTSQGGREKRCV